MATARMATARMATTTMVRHMAGMAGMLGMAPPGTSQPAAIGRR